jgi:hypothetical protein
MILPNRLTEEQTHDADVNFRGDEEAREKKEREMQSNVSFNVVIALLKNGVQADTRNVSGHRLSLLLTYGDAMKLTELLKKLTGG